MAVRTITTRLAIDGETAFKKAMTEVNASLQAVRSELELSEAQFKGQANSIEALTAKDKLLREEIQLQTEKVRALEQAMKDAAQIYGENSTQADRYRARLNKAKTELIGMNRALNDNSRYMREAQESADGTAHSIDEFGSSTEKSGSAVNVLASALAAAGVARGIQQISGAIRECADASVDFESAMAGVRKVTKMPDEDLSALGESIKQLSTEIPATTGEIAAVAESAARLGIAQEDILSFTRVMLDLGESSNLSADEAATALARFSNIAGTSAADYERLGSTIVALGNNFATSEAEITAMASRLASAGTLAGLTEAEIMALAAAMSSVGIEAEAGGTAMTQTLTAIEKAVSEGGGKLEEFARIAGMSSGEFAAVWKGDAVSAIQAFIAGLGGLDGAGESATAALDELGLSGVRQSNMLKSLGLASETLAGAVNTANMAWTDNTELAATAAARYDTTEAKMQMAANAANNLKIAIGDALTPALGELAEAGADGLNRAAKFIEQNPWLVHAITSVAAAAAVFAGTMATCNAVMAVAKVAQEALNAAMSMNPVLAVAAAVASFIAAIRVYSDTLGAAEAETQALTDGLEESRRAYEETGESIRNEAGDVLAMADALERLAAVENKSAAQKAAMADMVSELNEAVPGLALAYDAQTDSLNMSAEAIRNVAQAEAERRLRQADYERMVELYQEQAATARDLTAAEERLREAEEALNAMIEAGTLGAMGYELATMEAQQAVVQARDSVNELTAAQTENEAETETLAETFSNTAETAEDFSRTAKEAAKELKALREESENLAGAVDTLSKALKEQTQEGSLSLDTALKLIDAGYGAALAIDTETGAVTLNQAAYIELATAKINDQIASLEVQKQSEQNRARLEAEAQAELQSFTGAAETASRASSSRAKKAQTEALTDELEDRVKGIESQRKNIEDKLSGYGDLFTRDKNGNLSVDEIQEDIDVIERWRSALEGLRDRGIAQDLMGEILSMNVDDATEYGEKLLRMSDDQWEKYSQKWNEKQKLAADVAEQFYKDQLTELETEYEGKLSEALDGLTDTAFQSGADTAKGLIEGLASQEEALYAKARAMEQEVARILKAAWKDIPSNAEIAASLNPDALRTEPPATAQDVRQAVAAGVNGMQTAFAGIGTEASSGSGDVYLDSQKVGRIMLPGLRAEAKANPEVVDDT